MNISFISSLYSIISLLIVATNIYLLNEVKGLKILSPKGPLNGCQKDSSNSQCSLEGDIHYTQALFGVSKEGKSLVGYLFVALAPKNINEHGCQLDYSTNLLDASTSSTSGPTNYGKFFLFQGDAGCRYVEQVRSAQQNGAAAVIISDILCPCDTSTLPSQFVKNMCDPDVGKCRSNDLPIPYMVPGGPSDDITIPVFMVSKFDGQRLRDCFVTAFSPPGDNASLTGLTCLSGQKISISVDWSIPKTQKVEWEIWRSSDPNESSEINDFFSEKYFPNVASSLAKQNAIASPKFYIMPGEKWECTAPNQNGGYKCGAQCSNRGRYCHKDPDPESDLSKSPNGIDIVQENARQACLWKLTKEKIDKKVDDWMLAYNKYWMYVSIFAEMCTYRRLSNPNENTKNLPEYFSEKCSEEAHKKVELDFSKTLNCIEKSGGYGIDIGNNNVVLFNSIEEQNFKNLIDFPALLINGYIVRGKLTLQSFLSFVCAGMVSPPLFCDCVLSQKESTPNNIIYKTCIVSDGDVWINSINGGLFLSPGAIAAIVIVPFLFSLCCLSILYRRTRTHLKMELEREVINIVKRSNDIPHSGEVPVESNATGKKKGKLVSISVDGEDDQTGYRAPASSFAGISSSTTTSSIATNTTDRGKQNKDELAIA